MRAYKRLQTRYHEKVKEKWRKKIKCAVCTVIVIFVLLCFIGLVIGLSLGLKKDDKCSHDYERYCNNQCKDVRTDDANCGTCGKVCAAEAICEKSKCVFCTFNCSADNDICTVEPCDPNTGCTYQCPRLTLDGTSLNYTNTVTGSGLVSIVPNTLTLTSNTNIDFVTVKTQPALPGENINATASDPNIDSVFNTTTSTLTLSSKNSGGVAASNFQTLLRTLKYSATFAPGQTYRVSFIFQATNTVPTSLSATPTSFIVIHT